MPKAPELPNELSYFAVDTNGVHTFGGVIDNDRDDKRVRERYPELSTATRMVIGHYELVRVEEVFNRE